MVDRLAEMSLQAVMGGHTPELVNLKLKEFANFP